MKKVDVKIWHKGKKQFINWENFKSDNLNDMEFLMYSKIKDKNGKKIYLESDIIKVSIKFKDSNEIPYSMVSTLYLNPITKKITLKEYENFDLNDADEIEIIDNLYKEKKRNIIIHYDFVSGNELSYKTIIDETQSERSIKRMNYFTSCLQFFKDFKYDVTIYCKDGRHINNQELLQNTGEYINKQIIKEYDVLKMFLNGDFNWKKD